MLVAAMPQAAASIGGMSLVLLLKLVHVLAAIVAVGANVTYAFWLRLAGRDRDRLVWTIDGVRRLDRTIANPAYGVLLVTGVLMVVGGLYSFETGWIAAAIVLYVVTAIVGVALYGPAIRPPAGRGGARSLERGLHGRRATIEPPGRRYIRHRRSHRRAHGHEALLRARAAISPR